MTDKERYIYHIIYRLFAPVQGKPAPSVVAMKSNRDKDWYDKRIAEELGVRQD